VLYVSCVVCGLVLSWRRITSDIFLARQTQETLNWNFLEFHYICHSLLLSAVQEVHKNDTFLIKRLATVFPTDSSLSNCLLLWFVTWHQADCCIEFKFKILGLKFHLLWQSASGSLTSSVVLTQTIVAITLLVSSCASVSSICGTEWVAKVCSTCH
jgi:hypothetical protein